MSENNRTYIVIDLKSFYASVECVERGLNPLITNLVVADASRSQKTICLAVSPSLKNYGIPGRPRLFEVVEKVKKVNRERRKQNGGKAFTGKTADANLLRQSPNYAVDFLIARPRMALYLDYSAQIYGIYLKYVAPEDMHVYSIDETFMDVTNYLETYGKTAHDLAQTIIGDVLKTTGITATAGIGTNLYLAKVAMDIVAKKQEADQDGVRIAELDQMSYRRLLWHHQPLTDFWRVGPGYASKLEENGLFTMGDIARCSLGQAHEKHNEDLLYRLFGVNAELLIDHAWGYEPCTIPHIKAYKPQAKSIGSGQVLPHAYAFAQARMVVHEMADLLVLDLVRQNLVTNQIVLTIHYDREGLTSAKQGCNYEGPITTDQWGRKIPKHATGRINFPTHTSSTSKIIEASLRLFDRIVNPDLPVRKINIVANRVLDRAGAQESPAYEQLDLFADGKDRSRAKSQKNKRDEDLKKEEKTQQAILAIRDKYGKNSILKGMNLQAGATAKDKNKRIGGHRA